MTCLGLASGVSTYAQSAHVDINDGTYGFLNRIETLSGSFSDYLHLSTQALSRKDVALYIKDAQRINLKRGWSNVDNALMSRYLSQNGEWASEDGDGALDSRNPVMGTFYKKKTDFIYHNSRNFFLSANPVLGYQGIYETTPQEKVFRNQYAAGARIRVKYKDIIGADLNFRYVHEEPVSYYAAYNQNRNTLIGVHDYKQQANGSYDYILPTGAINASVLRNYISASVGYDYQKIGDGYRSLILSDFSGPVWYAKLSTKVWKFQYDNLYMRLSADHHIPGNNLTNYSGGYKYATAHHLSTNVTRWLNIGLYEMVVFNRTNHFEAGYMNPLIFYRAIERSLGSPDKVALGINAKAIPVRGLGIYGQFLLNEFTAKEFFANNGYMHNKWGAQLGLKYYDAFTVDNLDLQVEGNVVRPYTFQHLEKDNSGYIASNFTNNNLPLAHPLGAGFRELVFIANYRPTARLQINAKALYYQQGVDTGNLNFGNDLSKSYSQNIPGIFGVKMIHGAKATGLSLSLNISYEIAPNLNFDLGGTHRSYALEHNILPEQKSTYFYSGIRLNLNRKDYTAF
ncbi:hypothetical protein DBR32_07750 [Taibaiella sp. KBW10]|nr:hypothetical protein DBR32_07750 [Taibaiella sp. KBW10]